MPITTNGSVELFKAYLNEAPTLMTTANTYLGVGNSNQAFSVGDSDLIGGSKLWKLMDTSFPSRSGTTLTLQATFGASDAQWNWLEHGVKVGSTMFSRKVEALGDKTSVSQTWIFVLTATIGA